MKPALSQATNAIVTLGCAVYAAVVSAASLGGPVGVYDEAMYYVGALLLSRGQKVHLDFNSVYPPLNYELPAWALRTMGESVLAVRWLHVAMYLVLILGFVSFFRLRGARGLGLSVLVLATLVLTSSLPLLPSFQGTWFALSSILTYLHVREFEARSAWVSAAVVCGALIGITLFTRINFGFYVVALVGMDQAVSLLRMRLQPDIREKLTELSCLVAGGTIALAVLGIIFREQISASLDQTLGVPAQALRAYAKPAVNWRADFLSNVGPVLLTFPLFWLGLRAGSARRSWSWLALAVAFLLVATHVGRSIPHGFALLSFPVLFLIVVHQCTREPLSRSEFIATLACAFFAHYYVSLPDFAHQFPATAPLALLLPAVAYQTGLWRSRWFLCAAAVLMACIALPVVRRQWRLQADVLNGLEVAAASMAHLDATRIAQSEGLSVPFRQLFPDEDENSVVRYLRPRTSEREAVYIGLADHSRPYVNNMRLYWALGRNVGTRQFMLNAGISDTAKAQRSMVHDLQTRNVRWVVLWKGWKAPSDFKRQNRAGAELLDDYLTQRYALERNFGSFAIWRRRE